MSMPKRIFLFILTNILVMVTVSIIMNLLGVSHYLSARGINWVSLAIFCGVWGMAGAFISLAMSRFIAKTAMGVKVIDPNSGHELVLMVAGLCQKAGLPMPEVGIYESPEINAFATGPTKKRSLVAVSSGLLRTMSRDEVEGVLAHEVSHIANGDMVTMTLIAGVVNAFAMFLSRVISYFVSLSVKEDMAFLVRIVLTIALDIFFSILGSIVVAYFSRAREFRADNGGAMLAGREKMIAALESLKRNFEPIDTRGAALDTLKVAGKGGFMALFSTHPALELRIEALKRAM
ncbi:MAG TPA: protease HtpX [Deltaproteobacteria bacterium]|nr:protease HtpX [Deltaproteobacteria bacterium]HOI06649.1 protease HtpX [Deltaproteobacteria bacterium]